MTRHAYIDGDPTNPGHIYFEQDGARLRCELDPDDVIAALDAHMEHTGIVDAMAQEIENLRAELDGRAPVTNNPNDPKLPTPRGPTLPCGGMTVNYVGSGAGHAVEPNTVYDSSAAHWSPWLEWRGGPCPLPGDVDVEWERSKSGTIEPACEWTWAQYCRFRYHADNPAGWLPRGDWIPPAELWDDGCPVRCEWTCGMGLAGEPGTSCPGPAAWKIVTHIRLVARQPQAGLPEGWSVSKAGDLVSPDNAIVVRGASAEYLGKAAILEAVAAWAAGDGR